MKLIRLHVLELLIKLIDHPVEGEVVIVILPLVSHRDDDRQERIVIVRLRPKEMGALILESVAHVLQVIQDEAEVMESFQNFLFHNPICYKVYSIGCHP